MPVDSMTQARDETVATLLTAWQGNVASCDVPILFPDVNQEVPKDAHESPHWTRFSMRHSEGAAATLPSGTGVKRYRHMGTVTLQIFTKRGDGQRTADILAQIAKLAYQGAVTTPGGVIFRRARINEVGVDGAWFQTNVLTDFEYDEVK